MKVAMSTALFPVTRYVSREANINPVKEYTRNLRIFASSSVDFVGGSVVLLFGITN